MTNEELKFIIELNKLLNKYEVIMEEYQNSNIPEMGFASNFRSIRVCNDAKTFYIDLFNSLHEFFIKP